MKINTKKNYKILVIRLSSFGDIILTFPFIKELKSKLPDSRIDYLTKMDYKELPELNPFIDNIICTNHINLSEIRKRIIKEKYDFIFDLHKNLRSIYLCSYQKSKVIRYKKNNFKKLLLVHLKINLFRNIIPVYKKYLHTLDSIFENINYHFTSTELKLYGAPPPGSPYVLISPSSKHFTKTYPKEKYLEIVNKNKDRIFILTGSDSDVDMEICRYIQQNSNNTLNLCGKLYFSLLADFIKYSEYVICNDSGIMHLAEALNKKVYAFFGSTVREFGFYPQLKSSVVFENKNLRCRPCARSGKINCPKNHFKCMLEIKQEVL